MIYQTNSLRNKKNKIKIGHLNIQSMNKLNLLKHFLATNQIDIMLLNETFLNNSKTLEIDNYEIIRCDRKNRIGGGVCVIIHNSIPYYQKYSNQFPGIETITIEIPNIIGQSDSLFLTTYYNPPDSKIDINFLNFVFNISDYSLLIGDLNAHHRLWGSNKINYNGRTVFNCITENDIAILNDDSPTYWSINYTSSSIIDLALASPLLSKHIDSFEVCDSLHSDHSTVLVKLNYSGPPIGPPAKNNPDKTLVRSINFEKLNYELKKRVANYESCEPLDKTSIDTSAENITQLIQNAIFNSTTCKVVNVNKNKLLLLPQKIVHLIKMKRKARRLCQKYKTLFNKTEFYRLDRQVKNEIISFKKKKWQTFCSNLNTYHVSDSKLWKGIKSVGNSIKTQNSIKLLHNDQLVTEPSILTKIFAANLEKVFMNHESANFDQNHISYVEGIANQKFNETNHILSDENSVSYSELNSIIKNIRGKGAPGPDRITNKVIKELPCSIISILVKIFNASIKFSHIPSKWKNADVSMIKKPEKDPKHVDSYRPISLLNTLSKLLERVIDSRLQNWITNNNIITTWQCGFRKNRSTRDHLFRLTQECQQAFNKNMSVGALFIDIEKAFDRVWIKGLIFKLDKLNIPEFLGCWLKSYLSNRSFQVNLNGIKSSSKSIQASVPQGSVLGPTLFNLFFNDISSKFINSNHSLALFADDLSTWYASPYHTIIEKNLQIASNWIHEWCIKWRTIVSTSKSVTTIFSKNAQSKPPKVFYGSRIIRYDPNPKFLGVYFDKGLNFKKHTEVMCIRASKRLNMLSSMKGNTWGFDTKLLLTTYKVLVRTIFDYTSFINLTLAKTNIDKLSRIQNKAIRIATYWPPGVSTTEMLLNLNLAPIKERSIDSTVTFLNSSLKIVNQPVINMLDNYLKFPDVFEGAIIKKHKVTRKTLLGTILELPPCRLNEKKRKFKSTQS